MAKLTKRQNEVIQRLLDSRPKIDEIISAQEWADRAGVSYDEAVEAVGIIRDHWSFTIPSTGEKIPLITIFGRGGGYVLSYSFAIVEKGRRQMLKRALTTITRVWKGIVSPYLEQKRASQPQLVDQIQVSFDRLIEDTERVFALSTPNGTP